MLGKGGRADCSLVNTVGQGKTRPKAARSTRAECRSASPACAKRRQLPPAFQKSTMKFLAFDTSTETLSIAVQHGDQVHCVRGPGGARASACLIPDSMALLAQAGLTLADLDVIAFGQGPGAFTGLRGALGSGGGSGTGSGSGSGSVTVIAGSAPAADSGARR